MKNKFICALLTTVMVLSFAACGNEGNGLSDEIADLADTYIKIPMQGQVESLNAAISASLLMYETRRQRRH